MPLNSTHIQRIEFTKVNSHMHSILSLCSLWTQCEFSKHNVNSRVLPEFSHLSSFCAKKNVIQKEKIVCLQMSLPRGNSYPMSLHSIECRLSECPRMSLHTWVYPILSWVWVLCLNSPHEFVVGLQLVLCQQDFKSSTHLHSQCCHVPFPLLKTYHKFPPVFALRLDFFKHSKLYCYFFDNILQMISY